MGVFLFSNAIARNQPKFMKIFKRGFKNLLKDPSIIFNQKKQTIKLHFDMCHGHGIIDLAIDVMHSKDKEDLCTIQ